MNFLALILGLAAERLLTHLFHLREFHWCDRIFDPVYSRARALKKGWATALAVFLILLLVLPVAAVALSLSDRLAYIPSFVFAVFVLLFCLGPGDLKEDVEEFRSAIAADDQQKITALAGELLGQPAEGQDAVPDVEQAIYGQANNRIFAVVFWFILLGASGAWLFRVIDLMRRHALHRNGITTVEEAPVYVQVVLRIHTLLAWLPARLLAAGYTLAGDYDGAMQEWRSYRPAAEKVLPRDSDLLLGAIGVGAAARRDQGNISARAHVAMELVTRTLWLIWCPALALLTLFS